MKQGQFSNEQIVAILQEAEKGETPIIELCKEKGISEATFYAWRKKFGGMQTRDVQRLRELEKQTRPSSSGALASTVLLTLTIIPLQRERNEKSTSSSRRATVRRKSGAAALCPLV